ncbi:hypothetical protein FBHYGVHD_CDS0015 [Staphylococcus phage MVC_VPHSA1]|uniref:Uncharacterized protein n=1 Tax=Staphylococcus phage MVC_VPHSA1 TaxID=3088876 RepID=A0ABZ0QYQ4_9CAUD|nr:hypothetical protein FBHYGVHD_CDS0015 [Staphylococcus phage MVC_VPHSA1]
MSLTLKCATDSRDSMICEALPKRVSTQLLLMKTVS